MAAGFLFTRILLVFLLREVDYLSAFPRARSYAYPEVWHGVRKKQEGYGYGNRRPLQYIHALRQPYGWLPLNVHDQVQIKAQQKPQESSHAQTKNQPSVHHQTQSPYQSWSDIATRWTQEMSPSQHLKQRNHPLPKPRGFEFSLKVPFADFLGQNKEVSSTAKGSDLNKGGSDSAGHYSQLYRPSNVQVYSNLNRASGSNGFSDIGPTGDLNEGKTAHDVSKPSFQLSLSVPFPPSTPSPDPSSSNGGFSGGQGRPGIMQNSYMEPTRPQSSSTQSESNLLFLNSASTVHQQTEHQTYEPFQTKYTDSTFIAYSPGHANQYETPTEQISQGKIPNRQTLAFPEPSAPSLQIPQYPPLPSDNVQRGFYSAQINPLSSDYGKGQSGETVSPDSTNVHLSLSPSQYVRVLSEQNSAGQVKPNSNNYGQHQTWQPVGTPFTFASEQYDSDQLKQSFGQNVETVSHLSPLHLLSPTVAPSQYELPSFHQVATTKYYGTANAVQMEPTDSSSSSAYQYGEDQSGQETLPNHPTAFDPMPNFQDLSTDYQTQIRLPGQYTGRGHLNGKPKYIKLFIDVEDVMDEGDGQHNYFSAPPTHYGGYSSTQTH